MFVLLFLTCINVLYYKTILTCIYWKQKYEIFNILFVIYMFWQKLAMSICLKAMICFICYWKELILCYYGIWRYIFSS